MDIGTLVAALAPAFAAGFALQRLLEILDPILDKIKSGDHKKVVLGLISFVSGLGLAAWPSMRVLSHLVKQGDYVPQFLDYLVTGLILSGGTEGFNSILKLLNYKKEEKKAEAKAQAVTAAVASARAAFSISPEVVCSYSPQEIEQIVVGVYREQLDDDSITRFSRFGSGKEIDIDSQARRAFFFPIKQNIDREPDCIITKLTPDDVEKAKTVGEIIDAICDEFGIL